MSSTIQQILQQIRHTVTHKNLAKKELMSLIQKNWHKNKNITDSLNFAELFNWETFDLWELAITMGSGDNRKWVRTSGYDYSNLDDAKFVISSARNNKIKYPQQWTHSFIIKGITHKKGNLLVAGWNIHNAQMFYFNIPYIAYKDNKTVELVLEQFTSNKKIKYINKPFTGNVSHKHCKYWEYECKSFEDMLEAKYIRKKRRAA